MQTILWILFVLLLAAPFVLHIIQQNNLNYYKLSGRTSTEIERWLKTRKWFTEFYNNIQHSVLEEYKLPEGVLRVNEEIDKEISQKLYEVISGQYDTLTISSAFPWSDTPEGARYWGKREHEFLKWYFGQYIDFCLFSKGV